MNGAIRTRPASNPPGAFLLSTACGETKIYVVARVLTRSGKEEGEVGGFGYAACGGATVGVQEAGERPFKSVCCEWRGIAPTERGGYNEPRGYDDRKQLPFVSVPAA
jgi:hypothetical protein